MKKIKINEMEQIKASGDGQEFLSAFTCVAGLLTGAWFLAVLGCASLFGDW